MYPSVFNASDNTPIKVFKASLKLKPDHTNVVCAPYDLPFALIPVVDKMLEDLVKSGKAVPIMHSLNSSPCAYLLKRRMTVTGYALISKEL